MASVSRPSRDNRLSTIRWFESRSTKTNDERDAPKEAILCVDVCPEALTEDKIWFARRLVVMNVDLSFLDVSRLSDFHRPRKRQNGGGWLVVAEKNRNDNASRQHDNSALCPLIPLGEPVQFLSSVVVLGNANPQSEVLKGQGRWGFYLPPATCLGALPRKLFPLQVFHSEVILLSTTIIITITHFTLATQTLAQRSDQKESRSTLLLAQAPKEENKFNFSRYTITMTAMSISHHELKSNQPQNTSRDSVSVKDIQHPAIKLSLLVVETTGPSTLVPFRLHDPLFAFQHTRAHEPSNILRCHLSRFTFPDACVFITNTKSWEQSPLPTIFLLPLYPPLHLVSTGGCIERLSGEQDHSCT
ncbi:hypothetical protein SODALDRAFT_363350 [Sodiomyces alkalinus F11]|uniref:Uncharacterized protein n=1 Tax=Sodiomyces alkalinus (strain CBS 110278 / VKM F-3762 / F11) TaxID=1314773 RepID=A0A3N2PLW1_SODAK|nr:hypothetical protein SODALDRAFT_363350 [Sodiomyces alkalinus F11]ROT35513.1 hypothetical protein SODALDRAFT_363350 [Sodiomyces alkalinus F11]